ncbi:MAG TPA: condensation domain-containing protein, partial [Candidatus Angelobacter sp.]|nr:condensation domain-containing protein [Candidatus Angelobacter sp.]
MLETLPLMPNGKPNRQVLPAPAHVESQASTTTQRPIEEIITGICAHLLKYEAVSGADNFFEIGGHSLLATQLIARLRDSLALEIPVRWVFQSSTLAELAERVEEELGKAAPRLTAIGRRDETGASLPLSFAQQRLWFLDQLEPGNAVYNIPGSVRLRGALDHAALRQSLNEIIKRHEALRTRFVELDGQPVQVIEPVLELPIEVLDLSAMSATEGEVEAQRLATAEAALPFDLTSGPLLRVKLLQLAAEEHVLLLTMHHIISDGWSLGVLVREVGALYQAFTEGSASPLPALPIQYADYAVWQREQLRSEVLAEQLSYWREQLSGAPAVLELPTDHVRPAVKSYRGARERLELNAELTAALRVLSREQGVTLFMVLLAAFKVLLWRYAGQADVVVGTPIANRQQSEIEGLIGFFVNTLALRTSIEGSESFTNLLKRVREVCLGAYQHQDVPFEMVVEELAVERALNQTPIFQVMFVL